jgi:hypothetical protein
VNNIYHYTNAKGLSGILSSKKLWLTESFFLNDPDEIQVGTGQVHIEVMKGILDIYKNRKDKIDGFEFNILELLNEKIKHLREIKSDYIFICSFCKDGDLLSQWKGYANYGEGYSIGISRNYLESIPGCTLKKVVYTEKEEIKILSKILNKYLQNEKLFNNIGNELFINQMIEELFFEAYFFKSPFFREEKEYRLIYKYKDNIDIKQRPGNIGLIPYIEVDLDCNLITEIIIGPKLDFERNRKALILEFPLDKIKKSSNNLQ